MNLAEKFIRSSIQADSPQFLRKLTLSDMLDAEHDLFNFTRNHLSEFGRLPSLDALAENGFNLNRRMRSDDGPEYYFTRIKDRRIYNVLSDHHEAFRDAMEQQNVREALSALREMVSEGTAISGSVEYTTLVHVAEQALQDFEIARRTAGLQGVTLGYETLDAVTQGAQPGDVVVIAGRPSMGKSWILIEMLYRAWRAGHSVGMCSMGMSVKQIGRRFIGRHLGVNPNRIRSGDVVSWLHGELLNVQDQFADERPFHIMPGDMDAGIDALDAMVEQYSPDIFAVDAAYLMTPRGRNMGGVSRWETIAQVIKQLKQIAIRRDIPCVLTVQFNRNVKKNTKKELDLGDIAGSDSIPQDASIVLGIRQGMEPNAATQRIIDVMKNRDGDTPKLATRFSFDPVDFGEIELRDDGTPAPTTTGDVTSWM